MVLADTSRIVPCLGFLKFLGWWQWCDVDSADDGSELKTIFCGTPNTARGKFNRSNVNASGLLPVNLLNALCMLSVLLVLLPAASLLPTDFLLEPSEKYLGILWLMSSLDSVTAETGSCQLWDTAELEKLSCCILKHL